MCYNYYSKLTLRCFNVKKKKFKRKSIIVEAYQTDKEIIIQTLEGPLKASAGDWIITGIEGEQYPCKPDIFLKIYEEV